MHHRLPATEGPEYLALFELQGRVHVQVQFTPKGASIATRRCEPEALRQLIDPATQLPWTHMRFDDHLGRVDQWLWEPAAMRLTLKVSLSVHDQSNQGQEGVHT